MIEQILTLQDEVDLIKSSEISFYDAIKIYKSLPGLRGFWPFTSIDESGNIIDLSGHGLELAINGNPDINYHNNVVPYADLDGTGDYYSRADEALLDITESETGINSDIQGLTLGGWFQFNTLGSFTGLLSKNTDSGNQRSYILQKDDNDLMSLFISPDGTQDENEDPPGNGKKSATTGSVTTGVWYFGAGRFIASTSLDVWLNNEHATRTTSVPATIFNSSAAFSIGSYNAGSELLNGKEALCFLCASALPNATISYIYQTTRGLFGV